MMRVVMLPVLGLALLLPSFGCTQEGGDDDDVERRKVGDVIQDHALEGAADIRIRTSELRSRVLWIHFFKPTSGECEAQVKRINKLWFPLRAAGLDVLGVCPETDRKDVLRTMDDWNLPYPVFIDPRREFTREFAPRKYPWNVVVGRDGSILFTGKGNWDDLQAAVAEAVRVDAGGPDRVSVQHCLIAFKGSVPGKKIGLSRQAAEKLATEVFERAKSGENFGELVRTYSADSASGTYNLANFNVEVEDDNDESERGAMSHSFGDVAFSLSVGEIGLAEHHPLKSRFGWHIIKRLE